MSRNPPNANNAAVKRLNVNTGVLATCDDSPDRSSVCRNVAKQLAEDTGLAERHGKASVNLYWKAIPAGAASCIKWIGRRGRGLSPTSLSLTNTTTSPEILK